MAKGPSTAAQINEHHHGPWWQHRPWTSTCPCGNTDHEHQHGLRQWPHTAWSHVDICGLCYNQSPCWSLCSVQPLEAMFVFMVCAATWDHVDVCGLCYCLRPGQCQWSMLPLVWAFNTSIWEILFPTGRLLAVVCILQMGRWFMYTTWLMPSICFDSY